MYLQLKIIPLNRKYTKYFESKIKKGARIFARCPFLIFYNVRKQRVYCPAIPFALQHEPLPSLQQLVFGLQQPLPSFFIAHESAADCELLTA